VRVGYISYDQWVGMEGCKESKSNVIAGVDFSDSY